MKTVKRLKIISYLLMLLILNQSCHAYYKTPISTQEAIKSEKPLKINMNGYNYRIQDLYKEDEKLLVKTKKYSKLVKHMGNKYVKIEGKSVIIDLTGMYIESIREKNKSTSTVLTVITVIASVVAVAGIIGIIAFSSGVSSGGSVLVL